MTLIRPRFPFALKLGLVAVALAVVPPATLGLALIGVNERAVEEGSRELQLAVVSDIAGRLTEMKVDAHRSLSAVRRALVEGEISDDERLRLAQHLLEATPTLDHVVIHEPSGEVIDVMLQEASRIPVAEPLPPALHGVGDALQVGPPRADGRVRVALPIEVDGQVTGHVSSALSVRSIEARLDALARVHFAGRQAVRVVDSERRLLAGGEAAGEPVISPLFADLDPSSHRAGAAPSRLYVEGDTPMVGAWAAVAGTPWAVGVEQPEAVVYASLVEMRRLVVLATVGATLVALLFALAFARRLTRPIGALATFARQLSAHRFEGRVEMRRDDELGVLADAMNTAVVDLRAHEARLRDELAIRADLGRYLPGELVEQIVSRESDLRLGGARCEVTVLFADVCGFTPLSEHLPPEEIVTALNELFTLLTEIVFRHRGTVDKFIGDCVMAIWGAPTPQDDHAARALRAAVEMRAAVQARQERWRALVGMDLALSIGINSGEAVVGNVGSENRMAYTAIGDAVNVAARLQGRALPMQILASAETRRQAGAAGFDFEDLGDNRVKGRRKAVKTFTVDLPKLEPRRTGEVQPLPRIEPR
ncbi:MAG: adenylate/guanylate cyclase domain-containing protein [bacterium]